MAEQSIWTGAMVDRLRTLHQYHSSEEIAEILNLPYDTVKAKRAEIDKPRYAHYRVCLTTDELLWFRENYATTTNADICKRLGIKLGSLHRFARAYGLTKTAEFMTEWHVKIAELARQTNKRNNWPPKGYQVPKSMVNCFQKGVTNLMRLGPERFAETVRKATSSRNATIAKDKLRIRWGLDQKTKMKLNGLFRDKTYIRYKMRKLGYLIKKGGQEAIITADTQRSEYYEKRCREKGITIIKQNLL